MHGLPPRSPAVGTTAPRPAGDVRGALQGLLGLDESVSAGYEEIRIRMNIEADCSDEELDDLMNFAKGHSPVCTTVCRPVPVKVDWNRG